MSRSNFEMFFNKLGKLLERQIALSADKETLDKLAELKAELDDIEKKYKTRESLDKITLYAKVVHIIAEIAKILGIS